MYKDELNLPHKALDDNEDSYSEVFSVDDDSSNVNNKHPQSVLRPRDGPSSTSNIMEPHGPWVSCFQKYSKIARYSYWMVDWGWLLDEWACYYPQR